MSDCLRTARRSGRFASRRDFAEHLGISLSTLDNLEAARRTAYSRDTVTAVEVGLGWAPGELARVVTGARPRRGRDADMERLRGVWSRLSPELRALLADVAERVVVDLGR